MIETLLIIADVLLGVIALLLLAEYVSSRWVRIQGRWLAIRRKVFRRWH